MHVQPVLFLIALEIADFPPNLTIFYCFLKIWYIFHDFHVQMRMIFLEHFFQERNHQFLQKSSRNPPEISGDPIRQARLCSGAERWIGGLLGAQRTWRQRSGASQGGATGCGEFSWFF